MLSSAGVADLLERAKAALPDGWNEASTTTKEKYEKIIGRLADHKNGRPAADSLLVRSDETIAKQTWRHRKAAVIWGLKNEIALALDAGVDGGATGRRLNGLLEDLQAVKAAKSPVAKAEPKSKRKVLPKLPAGWQLHIWESVGATKYRAAIAVSMLSGARPEELSRGARLKIADGCIAISVECAKTGLSEPERRSAAAYLDTAPARYLAELVAQGTDLVRINSKDCFASTVREIGERAGFRGVSPYVFRHAFSAATKAHYGPEDVARALGHSNARSQRRYGASRQHRAGDFVPAAISSERQVRVKPSPPPAQSSMDGQAQLLQHGLKRS